MGDVPALVQRIRGDFVEMPGLRLTLAQAMRLWRLDSVVCRAVVEALVASRFLQWTPAGTIARADGC